MHMSTYKALKDVTSDQPDRETCALKSHLYL